MRHLIITTPCLLGARWLSIVFTCVGARVSPTTIAAVDPLTPEAAHHKMVEGSNLRLVFSDEFEIEHKFTAEDSTSPNANESLKWAPHFVSGIETNGETYYIPELAEITGGNMVITIKDGRRFGKATFQSAQVSTWHKFCFQGGYLEASYLPPYPTDQLTVNSLWSAFWTLSNLVRANYVASAMGQWPFSYDECTDTVQPFVGTAGNIEGDRQLISRCDARHGRFGLNRMQGRGGTAAHAVASETRGETLTRKCSSLAVVRAGVELDVLETVGGGCLQAEGHEYHNITYDAASNQSYVCPQSAVQIAPSRGFPYFVKYPDMRVGAWTNYDADSMFWRDTLLSGFPQYSATYNDGRQHTVGMLVTIGTACFEEGDRSKPLTVHQTDECKRQSSIKFYFNGVLYFDFPGSNFVDQVRAPPPRDRHRDACHHSPRHRASHHRAPRHRVQSCAGLARRP